MTGYPIACQTITWGEEQSNHWPEVFDQVAQAGYTGVEIGIRHIQRSSATVVKQLLDERGLKFVALHLGGNLEDPYQATRERQVLDAALDMLFQLEGEYLIYSGLRYRDTEQFVADLNALNRAAEKCADRGTVLLYHNHDWEFGDGARVMRALFADGGHHLGFCPDIGWVHRGGMDVIECLNGMKGRVGAVHFKDFSPKGETVMLGEGSAPLEQAAEWIRTNTGGMWVIAEQDRARVPASQAVARNAAYLKALFGQG